MDTTEPPVHRTMSVLQPMSVLAIINLVDSISYMVVAPSLIFYVLQVGGDKDIYGWIISSFSFASFLGKPVVGIWVDKRGNKFRMPYFSTFALAIMGGLMYFFANGFQSAPRVALGFILTGRLLGGFGAANQALGYAYIASVIPQEQQTKTNSLLSMCRIVGMASGPFFNLFLSKVNYTLTIGNFSMAVDPLNSVGLMVAIGNGLTVLYVFFALPEPPEKKKKFAIVGGAGSTSDKHDVWRAICSMEIILPLFILIVVNSSFQLIDTALAPAAADGLGWGPVETSTVLGSTSFVIFFCMLATLYLSDKISDILMVALGLSFWIVGGGGIYLFWKRGASVVQFVLPVVIAVMGFPFVAASNRSNYTSAVASKPILETMQALMQSVLSMAASVAGFITPGLVASFIVRTPEQVTASRDHRELTPWALYVPIVPIPILFCLYLMHRKRQKALKEESNGVMPADESTGLIRSTERRRSSAVEIEQAFSRQSEVARRMSAEVMGFTGFDTCVEMEHRKSLLHDLEELAQLQEVDFEET